MGYGLDKAAVEAVMTGWRFKPGTVNGEPVRVLITVEINFAIR